MTKNKLHIAVLAAVFALSASVSFAGGKEAAARGKQHHVAGEKLDSGLGKLPHYSRWAKHAELRKFATLAASVPGEKLDNGLGELPHYSQWAKHPEIKHLVADASRVPGEKLDSGLGELPPYLEWTDRTAGLRHSMEIASRR
ncbi:MAG: hypothetical protein ACK4N4_13755 [Burkholderiales bacterium]